MKERKDIDAKYKWDLSVIYANEESFKAEYSECEKMISSFGRHEKTMLKSAKGLLSAITDLNNIERVIEKLWQYASLNYATDTSNNAFQSMSGKMRNLAVTAGSVSWFFTPYIQRIDDATLDAWFAECEELKKYKRMIHKARREREHTLSDECERLMAKMDDCLGGNDETRSLLANADLKFGKIKGEDGKMHELTDTNYVPFLMSSDRRVRQAAFRTLYKTYAQFGNTLSSLYNCHVKEAVTVARVRGYKNSITASTFRDEVTPEIYNNLIKSVNNNRAPLYDYYELKREVLGLDKLHLYDVYAPLVGSFDKQYSYEEAVEEVLKTAEVLGEEYYSTLKSGLLERGWVDVYPSRGKRGGAFSSGCPDTEPYILLNYNGSYDNVSTLAHEAGHSMHSYFSIKYNEPHETQYTIFVAEVASTVNELLMAHRRLAEAASDEEKLYILNQLMETYKGTLYRQTMFAQFERDMHALAEKGEPLTFDLVSKKYYRIVKKYFGPRVACDKQIAYEWLRIPHFYSSFYVYKYATCISAASAIVKRIESEGEQYINKYISFLKCGDNRSPLDSLLVAEIDMRDPAVVMGAVEDFAACVAQFREIYNKIKK